LRAADLRAADLRAVDFRAVFLRAAVLRAGLFRAAVFRAALFRAVDLRAVDLRAVLLRAAVLRAAVFRAAVLRAAAFRGAVFRAVDRRAVVFLLAVRFFPVVLVAIGLLRCCLVSLSDPFTRTRTPVYASLVLQACRTTWQVNSSYLVYAHIMRVVAIQQTTSLNCNTRIFRAASHDTAIRASRTRNDSLCAEVARKSYCSARTQCRRVMTSDFTRQKTVHGLSSTRTRYSRRVTALIHLQQGVRERIFRDMRIAGERKVEGDTEEQSQRQQRRKRPRHENLRIKVG